MHNNKNSNPSALKGQWYRKRTEPMINNKF